MDTGGTDLSAFGPIVNGVQRPLRQEFIGWIWNPDQNRWGFVGQYFAPLFLDLHSTVEGSWSLTDCKSACNEETLCGGFTFIEDPAVPYTQQYTQQSDTVISSIHGQDIELESHYGDLNSCKARCDSIPACVGFVGNKDLNGVVSECWMKDDVLSNTESDWMYDLYTKTASGREDDLKGACHFKQINNIVLDDIPPDIENKNLYSAYRKCTQSNNTNPT
tara:strand:+ start:169 stop:825 length:657 start_codon:yes stop_codon:yes gene_type:complete